MSERKDSGKETAVAYLRKYTPETFERKNAIEAELIPRGFEGMALETEALRILALEDLGPSEELVSHNALVDVGRALWSDLLIGAGGTTYTNAVSALGVGDSAAAYAAGQTNLQGAVVTTDRIRKAMDATFPSRAANVVTWRATFATTEANFIWNEWAIFNNVTDASGTMLNRAVVNLGTKTSAAAWQLTVTTTLT